MGDLNQKLLTLERIAGIANVLTYREQDILKFDEKSFVSLFQIPVLMYFISETINSFSKGSKCLIWMIY